ncbi:MAG TPA: TSUP family transporter [Gammaproteobacteria bacterium]
MDYALITITALVVSGVTLFSGFGLGTVLMPAFAVFFPIPVAIGATAVVHLANNLFKVGLVGREADWRVVMRFSVPAAIAAVLGASALVLFAGFPLLGTYELLGRQHEVTAIRLVIGVLIVGFAVLELSPTFATFAVPPQYLVVGGLLSGFFGGLSGNQGAFRSAFLIKSGLSKEAFVATGVMSAVIVDTVRVTVYGVSYFTASLEALPPEILGVVVAATAAAFTGAYLGARLLEKVTHRVVRIIVAFTMIGIGFGLAAGLI